MTTKEQEKQMSQDLNEDIRNIHRRIDSMHNDITEFKVETARGITRIETVLKTQPAPRTRPCTYFDTLKVEVDGHISDHKSTVKTWKDSIIGGVVKTVIAGIIAAVAYVIGTSK